MSDNEKTLVVDVDEVSSPAKHASGPVHLPTRLFAVLLVFRLLAGWALFNTVHDIEPACPSDSPRSSGLSPLATIAVAFTLLWMSFFGAAGNHILAGTAGASRWRRTVIALAQIFSIAVDAHLVKVYVAPFSAKYVVIAVGIKWALELAALNARKISTLARRARGRGSIVLSEAPEPAIGQAAQGVESNTVAASKFAKIRGVLKAPAGSMYLPQLFALFLTCRLLFLATYFHLIRSIDPAGASAERLSTKLGSIGTIVVGSGAIALLILLSFAMNRALYYTAGPPGSWLRKVAVAVHVFSVMTDLYLIHVYAKATLDQANSAFMFLANTKWLFESSALYAEATPEAKERLRKRLGLGRIALSEAREESASDEVKETVVA